MATTHPAPRPMSPEERKVIFASSLGTVFEWYDFYLYGSLAAIIAKQFFSGLDAGSAFIFALLAFAAGFIVRPFGAIFFGREFMAGSGTEANAAVAAPAVAMTQIAVAKATIEPGKLIDPSMVEMRDWPESAVPAGAEGMASGSPLLKLAGPPAAILALPLWRWDDLATVGGTMLLAQTLITALLAPLICSLLLLLWRQFGGAQRPLS